MRTSSGNKELQAMPHWLLVAYRFATALAILMLIAAAASLVALAFLVVRIG